jgi:hypothetical protein
MNEQYTPVFGIIQFIKNLSVENKNGLHGQAAVQGLEKSMIIFGSQVAPEPEYVMYWV